MSGDERCPILTGRAWAFGPDVPASCIAPARTEHADAPAELLMTPVDPAELLMTPVDPEFPSRVQVGDFLVAGRFGSGTTDAGPVRAICAAGVGAVVASRLDPTFTRLALSAGLPVVEVYEALGIHTGEILRVDLEGARVVNLSSGDRYPIRNLDEEMLVEYRRRLDPAASEA